MRLQPGLVAAAGAWFFAVQRLGLRYPQWKRAFFALTAAGVAVIIAALAVGMLGYGTWPRSLEVRFEYWRAAHLVS